MSVYVEVVTSPDSPQSPRAMAVAQRVVSKMDEVLLQEVNTITQYGQDRALAYGVTAFPSIVIDGRIVFIGIPEESALRSFISDAIRDKKERESYFF